MSGSAFSAILLEACADLGRVGVAVSGGGDSVAVLVLAVEALGARRVAAVTVDHGLRPEAADEAAGVAALCARLGVAHDILHWDAGPQGGNLMDEARAARLSLIGAWARGRVEAVLLGHTQDDQAETFLMRLARGSGVDGLSGMEPRRRAEGVVWLRPFLGVSREALRSALRMRGIGWVEDPSNDDPRFQRVRARRALTALADLGLDAEGLAATAFHLRRARMALEAATQAALARDVTEDRGSLLIRASDWPEEIRDRLFAHLLMHLSGEVYRPRFDELTRLLRAGEGTLAGCLLRREEGGWRLSREARALPGRVAVGAVWDHRWTATGAGTAEIGALGETGLVQLSRQAKGGLHPHWRETGLDRAVLAGLPALWREGRLLAAPLHLWPRGWQLNARPLAAICTISSQSH